jgi:hypothetical protein
MSRTSSSSLKIRDLKAEVVRGDVLDQMCFVENDGSVVGYNASVLIAADIEISKEKMMVDDDDVGRVGTRAHARDEARFEIGAFLPDTDVAARIYAVPE